MAEPPTSLFSTSWTLHRVSPLYHAKQCASNLLEDPSALRTYASRLRDTLTGDVLRGVQLSTIGTGTTAPGTLDDALAKAGALKECKWSLIPTWVHWNEEQSLLEDEDEGPALSPEQCAGIMVCLEYENITYKAALLAGPDGYKHYQDGDGVTFLPLLLTRMPNALRQELISFLCTQFDTRVSVLRLPSSFLISTLEGYLSILAKIVRAREGLLSGFIERVIKETQLTLSFPPPIAPALRSLDVLLPRDSLSEFYRHGSAKTLLETPSTPFLSALSEYFSTHLAMSLNLANFKPSKSDAMESTSPYVRLTKLSCGAFVLGAEGRLKLLSNPGRVMFLNHEEDEDGGGDDGDTEDREKRLIWRANEEMLRALVRRAMGGKG